MGTCLPAAGRIGQLFQLLSNMLRVAFALTCLVAVSQAGAMEKIHRDINKFNNDVMCWGRENVLSYHAALKQACDQCMQFSNPNVKPAKLNTFQTLPQPINNKWSKLAQFLNRNKRQAEGGLLETDESDVEEFLQNFVDWKGDLASKMGNLTCVMTKLNMLDSNLQVNMDLYTTTSWEQMDLSETQTPHGDRVSSQDTPIATRLPRTSPSSPWTGTHSTKCSVVTWCSSLVPRKWRKRPALQPRWTSI